MPAVTALHVIQTSVMPGQIEGLDFENFQISEAKTETCID